MGFDAYVSGGFPGAGPSILIKENAAIFGHFQSYSMNHVRLSWDIEIFVDGNHSYVADRTAARHSSHRTRSPILR